MAKLFKSKKNVDKDLDIDLDSIERQVEREQEAKKEFKYSTSRLAIGIVSIGVLLSALGGIYWVNRDTINNGIKTAVVSTKETVLGKIDTSIFDNVKNKQVKVNEIEEFIDWDKGIKDWNDKSKLEDFTVSAGKYRVGVEIPEGKYMVNGILTQYENRVDLEKREYGDVLAQENQRVVDLSLGDIIELTSGKMEPVPLRPVKYVKELEVDQQYVVGQDLPQGEYLVVPGDGDINSSNRVGIFIAPENRGSDGQDTLSYSYKSQTYIDLFDGDVLDTQSSKVVLSKVYKKNSKEEKKSLEERITDTVENKREEIEKKDK